MRTTPVSRRLLSLAFASSIGSVLYAQSPDRRLPIREEPMLAMLRTRPLPPKLQNVSISPDGTRLIYEESETLEPNGTRDVQAYLPGIESDSTRAHLWLVDIKSGKRQLLSGHGSSLKRFRFASIGMPQLFATDLHARWSKDGRRIALLEQTASGINLVAWRVDRPAAPVRVALPRLQSDSTRDPVVTRWVWPSDERIVLAVMPGRNDAGQRRAEAAETSWSWSLSRASMTSRLLHEGTGDPNDNLIPQYFAVVDLKANTVRWVAPRLAADRSPYQIVANRYGITGWDFIHDGTAVITRRRDPRFDRVGANYLMWLWHVDSLPDASWRNGQARVDSVDLATGLVFPVYRGSLGQVTAATQARRPGTLVMVEGDSSLSTWPMMTEWGRVRWRESRGSASDVLTDTVTVRTRLIPSDRADVVYGFDTERLELMELDRRGTRTPLNPSDLGVTDIDVSADGRVIAAVIESVARPPEIYAWTAIGRQWRKLTNHGAGYPSLPIGGMEWTTWRSKDGIFDVDGIVVTPPHARSSVRYPLLVFLQGGVLTSHSRFENRFDPLLGFAGPPAQIFANAGYVSLFVNHRAARFGDFLATKSLVGRFGIHLDDVEAGVDALIAKGVVNPDQLGVLSNSHGSDEMMYLISETTRYRAAMLNDGTVPLPDVWVPTWGAQDNEWDQHHNNTFGRVTLTKMMGHDPVEHVWADPFKSRTPLLIRWSAQGRATTEPLSMWTFNATRLDGKAAAAKLLYAYRRNNVPIDMIIDRDGHGIGQPAGLLEWQSRLLQWFDYFLLGKGENPIPAMRSPIEHD